MKLTELKTELSKVKQCGVSEVFFEFPHEFNRGVRDGYPIVYFDMNSLKATEYRDGSTDITVTAFILDLYDKADKLETRLQVAVWDNLHEVFKKYIAVQNAGTTLLIDDSALEYELYNAGIISVDSELAIGYALSIKTYC